MTATKSSSSFFPSFVAKNPPEFTKCSSHFTHQQLVVLVISLITTKPSVLTPFGIIRYGSVVQIVKKKNGENAKMERESTKNEM